MTGNNGELPEVSSFDDFEETLEKLVEEAVESDIDVRGAKKVEVEDHPRNYEVYISALESSSD